MKTAHIALLGLILALCQGCLTPKSYVDPTFHDATYESLHPADNGFPIVMATVQLNGRPRPEYDANLRTHVINMLRRSRMFSEEVHRPHGRLDIVLNNVGDVGDAFRRGMGTGLSLGLSGSYVIDGYQMELTYTPVNGTPVVKNYMHAVFTTFGAQAPPVARPAVPLNIAVNTAVEDMVLNFLRDMQKEGRFE